MIEASFKGVARALRDAVRVEGTGRAVDQGHALSRTVVELLPAIDLRDGHCVRLHQGDFAAETVYDDDPVRVAREFEAAGARWIHVVDLDAARTGTRAHLDQIAPDRPQRRLPGRGGRRRAVGRSGAASCSTPGSSGS